MALRVYITGLGPVGPLGQGIDEVWSALAAGKIGLGPVSAFDASGTGHDLAGEVTDLDVKKAVPKSYRKAVKVMARDIELAVVAAKLAAKDAGLVTPGTAEGGEPGVAAERFGCHIGAGLIAADENELGAALAGSTDDDGSFSLKKWGAEGMQQLTPLWLLKYLPNMLACHVTIIHEARGPSNTITCGEASGGLSIGESLRVIQRGAADACFCGGAESRLNPMAFHRQVLGGRLAPTGGSVRPFDENAEGTAVAEGGGILVIETAENLERRGGAAPRARLSGFASSQTFHPESLNRQPDPEGRAIAASMRRALADAGKSPEDVDAVIPFGIGHPLWDAAEASALRAVFGDGLDRVPVLGLKASTGNLAAGAGGFEVAVAAEALSRGELPPIVNRKEPRAGCAAKSEDAEKLETILVASTAVGGQNTALVLEKA
ncbi:beta-ketoacyl-[acyl-carrier-protein] synthase family protein [Phycisphaera mikurensis]|uniref:Putative 3-oxoacyl-[acyl-carrier-protein] synthase II n=1 Tax=Phycisphaera mikurensis (strain NBRC 102666 / KCTC 22515 / FYK2301M01) TaxID=1142394 RepID=I0IB34_PHYMF|nr:beta-ketoacyl synthase N-terminal-like domain-containing protein [Phycisphaera mikurensis]MBB6442557.1 3-oxoacyl-[acyl-carrier-protein] synthase II [Phycisphaera mikurensis]BAM02472.1 putative 3-oxoacyl-[acyl-carrier-protein] synthase II [Phycisphaera mikurensis NBRC 102666]